VRERAVVRRLNLNGAGMFATRLLPLPILGIALFVVGGSAAASGAGGVSGPAFYVDGVLYRTVGTPTDLSNTGAGSTLLSVDTE
jgi:hypothetical protein